MARLIPSILVLLALFLPPAQALDVPPATGYVNDRADLLSPGVELKLEHFLEQFEKSDSTQLVVLTIPSLAGEALEGYSLKVAETWGIGQRGKDNGALLLIAKKERRMRIEVGYGLEDRLTDLLTGRILDREIRPRFKQGDYEGGVIAGVAAMAKAVRGAYQGDSRKTGSDKRSPLGFWALLLFLGPWLMLTRSRRRSSRGGIWFGGPFSGGGGFGSGGGFGGGGGGFGGGGSSGSW
jgi:uncharacterized protein